MKRVKILSFIVCIALLASIFTGCAQPAAPAASESETKPEENKKVTITYWQHSSQARDNMMKALAYEFMQDNTDIEVKMEFIPSDDYATKLISSLATDAAPDVMQVESGMIARLAKVDAIQPLDASVLPADSIKNDFIPASVDALQVGGVYYGLPTDVQTIVMYWNKDLVAAAGLDAEKGPQTWDELLDWAKKLTKFENGKMAQSGFGGKGYHPEVQAFVVQNGGKMVDENGQYCFADDPKSVEAIRFLVDAYRVHKVYDLEFAKNWAGFRVGKVAMMLGHPAMFGNLKQTAPNINLGIGLIPAKEGKHTTVVTSWAYVASKKANSAAATKWIQYLTSQEVEKRWTQETGELPARKALLADEDLVKDPKLQLLLSSMNDSSVAHLQMGILGNIFKKNMEGFLVTDEPLEDMLKRAQEELNKEIAKDL